jgi:prepilin signal peptidase PulO-like enzyme (type II secretory pathway)
MIKVKTVLLFIAIFAVQLIVAVLIGVIWGLLGISIDLLENLITVLAFGFQFWIMGFLASKVKYRYRDTFLQIIPVYGVFWVFRILYRTVERWTKK